MRGGRFFLQQVTRVSFGGHLLLYCMCGVGFERNRGNWAEEEGVFRVGYEADTTTNLSAIIHG